MIVGVAASAVPVRLIVTLSALLLLSVIVPVVVPAVVGDHVTVSSTPLAASAAVMVVLLTE